jgi:hypothetical protein
MKSILISVLILLSIAAKAQCDQATAWVFSISPGYAKTGITFSMEAGLWPVDGRVGILAGPVMYSRREVIKDKTETITDLDFTGRLIFKITELGDNCPQLVTIYGTARGNVGGSFRGYISLGRSDIIGVEPFYGTRTGVGVSIIFTTRL